MNTYEQRLQNYLILLFLVLISLGVGLAWWQVTKKIDTVKYNQHIQSLGIVKYYHYTNDPKMTDDSPNIMASGKNVYSGAIAVSRDLLDYVMFGDIVKIAINGKLETFVVEDVMNIRHKRCIDIFTTNKKLLKKSGKGRLYVVVF